MARTLLKILLPVLLLAAGALGAYALVSSRPEPRTAPREATVPLVRVVLAEEKPHRFRVRAQGTVSARTETSLTPEVSGRVVSVSPSFADGGFFEEGAVLLQLDASDYEASVASAEAQVASSRLRLAQEQEESDVARREWASLQRQEEATPLVRREPQLAQAKAALSAAEAALTKARHDLERARIRAPYDGRVRRTHVDLGSFVTLGVPVADVYAVDVAEIRLPLPDDELKHIDLPLDYRGGPRTSEDAGRPAVVVHATFAGRRHAWKGRLVRTEGEIDPRTRMVHVVVQVEDPYGRGDDPDRPPLAVGMFVEAEILGRRVDRAVSLPRAALREDGRVLVVDDDDRLRFREVEVLRATRDAVVIGAGLDSGERICLSSLDTVVDGMKVRAVEQAVPGPAETEERDGERGANAREGKPGEAAR